MLAMSSLPSLSSFIDRDTLLLIASKFQIIKRRIIEHAGGVEPEPADIANALIRLIEDEDKKRLEASHSTVASVKAISEKEIPTSTESFDNEIQSNSGLNPDANSSEAYQSSETNLRGNTDPLSATTIQEMRTLRYYLNMSCIAYESSDSNAEKKLSDLEFKVISSRWVSEKWAPGYYLAHSATSSTMVLCVRGTLEAADFLTDMCMDNEPFLNCYGHLGIVKSAENIYNALFETLRSSSKELQPSSFVLTGHSLGGAVASALTLLLRRKTNGLDLGRAHKALLKAKCYAFCPPPFLSDLSLASNAHEIVSVINGLDIIPRFCIASFDKLLYSVSQPQKGERAVKEEKSVSDMIMEAGFVASLTVLKNIGTKLEEFNDEKAELVLGNDEEPPQLYVAGRILHLDHLFSGRKHSDEVDKCWTQIRKASPTDFLDIEYSSWMLEDHKSDVLLGHFERLLKHTGTS